MCAAWSASQSPEGERHLYYITCQDSCLCWKLFPRARISARTARLTVRALLAGQLASARVELGARAAQLRVARRKALARGLDGRITPVSKSAGKMSWHAQPLTHDMQKGTLAFLLTSVSMPCLMPFCTSRTCAPVPKASALPLVSEPCLQDGLHMFSFTYRTCTHMAVTPGTSAKSIRSSLLLIREPCNTHAWRARRAPRPSAR